MNNAFTILGAEPTDSAERLQELLDEKELLLDDVSEVQSAYADLTNPKKRVQHEIAYFCEEALSDFNKLVSRSFIETPTIGKVANILVELGWWFESDNDELFDRINDARSDGGFTQLDDESIVALSVENLKQECISSTNSYFDRLTEKALVNIFNQIVKIEDYESFFIDELLAYYELTISEQLQEKEKKCETIFNEIERLCNQFNNGGSLSYLISGKVTEFGTALKDWDSYAQPLQVNMQRRGGQHDSSGALVHDIRNRVIELCNRSQAEIGQMLNDLTQNDYYAKYVARDKLPQKLSDSVKLTEILLKIIDILSSVFAELEITAEQLKKDKKDLTELKNTLTSLNNQVQEAKKEGERQAQLLQSQMGRSNSSTNDENCCRDCCGDDCGDCCGHCYVATCVYGSYDCPEVWTLRRYRDKTLGSTWYGRLFIRLYYAISPTIVKLFGKTKWFKKMWKGVLDKKVKRLQDKGFEDTPYEDIDWKKH